ncbi:MAG: hypothetical protein ACLGXA_07910, partial [Acidobacteriota bacterium]
HEKKAGSPPGIVLGAHATVATNSSTPPDAAGTSLGMGAQTPPSPGAAAPLPAVTAPAKPAERTAASGRVSLAEVRRDGLHGMQAPAHRMGDRQNSGEAPVPPASGEPTSRVDSLGGRGTPAIAGAAHATEPESRSVSAVTDLPKSFSAQMTGLGATAGTPPVHALRGTLPSPPPPAQSAHGVGGSAFERMDAAGAPRVIESSPQRLAVGVHSGGLGWVEIHTSSAAGQVTATLASGSAESHSALAAQLPTVREFLAGEHVRIDHLASEQFTGSSGGQGGAPADTSRHGGDRGARTTAPEPSHAMVSAEVEMDDLSYISVRV